MTIEYALSAIIKGDLLPSNVDASIFDGCSLRAKAIWDAAVDVEMSGGVLSEVAIADNLLRNGRLTAIGGIAGLLAVKDGNQGALDDDLRHGDIVTEARADIRQLPAALNKALTDPFQYAVKLADGDLIIFESASYEQGSDYVHLVDIVEVHSRRTFDRLRCARGIDVRISAIAWACDAPFGL